MREYRFHSICEIVDEGRGQSVGPLSIVSAGMIMVASLTIFALLIDQIASWSVKKKGPRLTIIGIATLCLVLGWDWIVQVNVATEVARILALPEFQATPGRMIGWFVLLAAVFVVLGELLRVHISDQRISTDFAALGRLSVLLIGLGGFLTLRTLYEVVMFDQTMQGIHNTPAPESIKPSTTQADYALTVIRSGIVPGLLALLGGLAVRWGISKGGMWVRSLGKGVSLSKDVKRRQLTIILPILFVGIAVMTFALWPTTSHPEQAVKNVFNATMTALSQKDAERLSELTTVTSVSEWEGFLSSSWAFSAPTSWEIEDITVREELAMVYYRVPGSGQIVSEELRLINGMWRLVVR